MNAIIEKQIRLAVAAMLTALLTISCDESRQDNDRNNSYKQTWIALGDSIKHSSPNARRKCDSIMASATDSGIFYDFYILKGSTFTNSTTPDSACIYAQQARNFARRLASKSPHSMTLMALANSLEASTLHFTRQTPERVVQLNTEAYDQIMRSDFIEHAPDIAANLGDAYFFIDDIPAAAKWYRKALFLVDSLNLPKERNTTLYMGLGRIYTALEDYDSAQKYYELTERQYNKMEPNMQAYFLITYGNFYYYKGDYGKALATFLRLKDQLAKHDEGDMTLYTYKINLADVYLNLNQTDSATAYVEEAARFFNKEHVDIGIYYANTIRIGLALKRKDYATIEKILTNEGSLDIKEQSMKNIRSKYLANYYAATGNYRKAFENARHNYTQNDSTEHSRQNMRASEIMARFTEDTLRLHYELELSKRNAKVQESKSALIATVGMLVVLVSGVICGIVYTRKRRMQTDMDIFMLRLAGIRQRISPHFVFNVLNAKIGNAPQKEADILVNMAKLIRQNLDLSNRPYVTLYEELNFVKDYVELQRTLLGEDMVFTIDAPDEDVLEEIKIPSMFVQILVENAIKHGLKYINGQKRLTIKVDCTDGKNTIITVTDNGPGFDVTRTNGNSTKTGFDVIRRTMSVMNRQNKKSARMTMTICNVETEEGKIAGCQAGLTIPLTMKLI